MQSGEAYKPLIGITAGQAIKGKKFELEPVNAEAVAAGGGVPIILPAIASFEYSLQYLKILDGLMLSGGPDILPKYYGEEPMEGVGLKMTPERDPFELEIIKKAMEIDMPILGICRGMQCLAVANGGSLYQDIDTRMKRDNKIKHLQECAYDFETHKVEIEKASILYRIFHDKVLNTNSMHHQAVRQISEDFFISGKALDGVVEAIESKHHRFVLGVQWHPEYLQRKNPYWVQLFKAFVAEAGEFRRLHQ